MMYPRKEGVILQSYLTITAIFLRRPLASVPKVAGVDRVDCIKIPFIKRDNTVSQLKLKTPERVRRRMFRPVVIWSDSIHSLFFLFSFLFSFFQNIFSPQIYDTATGHKILTLHDSNNTNNYSKNLASFNPTDDLVLNDGVLWDVKGKRVIHKFDKFNNFVSGVFHPSGLEIIINSEIVSLINNQLRTSLFLSNRSKQVIKLEDRVQ